MAGQPPRWHVRLQFACAALTPVLPPPAPPGAPQAADLDHLLAQMGNHPAGKEVTYVFLSRTAAGSSPRFASAAATAYLMLQAERRAAAAAAAAPAGVSPTDAKAVAAAAVADDLSDYLSPTKRQRLSAFAGSMLRVESDVSDLVRCGWGSAGRQPAQRLTGEVQGAAWQAPQHTSCPHMVSRPHGSSRLPCVPCSRSALAGEYRGIMNLCRVLPNGLDFKAAVDEAINRWVCWCLCWWVRGCMHACSGGWGRTGSVTASSSRGSHPCTRPRPPCPAPRQVRRHRQPARRHPRLQGGVRGRHRRGGGCAWHTSGA